MFFYLIPSFADNVKCWRKNVFYYPGPGFSKTFKLKNRTRHMCFILLTLLPFPSLADNVKCSQTTKFHFMVSWWYLAKKVIFFYGRNKYHCNFILVQLINNKSNLTGWPSVCPKWQGQMSGLVSVAWDCGSTIRWLLGLLLKPALLQYDHRCLIDD